MSEWKKCLLETQAALITKGTTPTSLGKSFTESGVNFIKAESITDAGNFVKEMFAFIDEETHELLKRSQLQKGDILFSIAGVLGRIAIVSQEVLPANTNQAIALIRLSSNAEIERVFLSFFLNSEYIKEQIRRINVQAAQANFSLGDINRLYVKFPINISTQRKIARILSTADAVIEKTQAAIAKYKAIKQGMLHDLFTRGIDPATGKLRPTYEDAPELYKDSKLGWIPKGWEVLSVADVSENLDGKRIPVKQEDRDKQAEIYPYYGASGIIDYVEDYIFDETLILLGEDGENVVSRNLPLAFKVEGKYWVNNHAHVLKPIKNISTIDFLCEALEFVDYSTIVSGSAQPKITQGHLSKILLRIPKIKEQDHIGNRIRTIDQKLQIEQNYLYKLQQIKAGLMADLLSGKKKVNVDEEPVN